DERIAKQREAGAAKPMPKWTLHDLRRTAAVTMADKLGVLPHIVDAILNHMSGHRSGMSGIYNLSKYTDEMYAALCNWAYYADEVTSPSRPKAVSFRALPRGAAGGPRESYAAGLERVVKKRREAMKRPGDGSTLLARNGTASSLQAFSARRWNLWTVFRAGGLTRQLARRESNMPRTVRNFHCYTIALAAAYLSIACPADAVELKLLSPNAMKTALNDLIPQFERLSGHHVTIFYATASKLVKEIDDGRTADVAILSPEQIEQLEDDGKVVEDSVTPVAKLEIGLIIRKGATKPDISTV